MRRRRLPSASDVCGTRCVLRQRCFRSSMLVVDAISERGAAFYEGNGFVRLHDSLRLVLPMHAIQQLVEP